MELGRYGVFGRAVVLTTERARILESLGYGTVWEGGSPPAELSHAEAILDATTTIKVATGIVNVWRADAVEVARSYHRIEAAHPGRFLLGIGVGHPESTATYHSPYQTLVEYLDVLDAEGVPAERRILAALGPRVLRLAGKRTAGAHPYLVTPEHSRQAREILGAGKLLAPEQRVVLEADPVRARVIGRPSVRPYLRLSNYTANLQRLGFTARDVAGEGSDRLIDALVVSGDDAQIRRRLEEHHAAGADHVAVQLIAEPGTDLDAAFRRLAEILALPAPQLRRRSSTRFACSAGRLHVAAVGVGRQVAQYSPIHDERLAGDERRRRASEVGNRLGDVVGVAGPLDRLMAQPPREVGHCQAGRRDGRRGRPGRVADS